MMDRLRDYTLSLQSQQAEIGFARLAIARALTSGPAEAFDLASRRWGATSDVARAIRMAAVPGVASDNPDHSAAVGTHLGQAAFVDSVRELEIISRLRPRTVPPHVPVIVHAAGAVATWTASGKAAPVASTAFARRAITPLKPSALLVVSSEFLASTAPEVEAMLLADLRRACVQASDEAFIDITGAGIAGRVPQSITYAAPALPSSSLVRDDLAGAIEIFDGDLTRAAWVMHPALATRIALSFGVDAESRLGPRGGELLGMPVITSQACQWGSSGGTIALIDASAIVVADAGADVQRSVASAIEMQTDPTGATDTPVGAATTNLVSLFQADAIGIMVTRRVNWIVARPHAVVTVTGCLYEGS